MLPAAEPLTRRGGQPSGDGVTSPAARFMIRNRTRVVKRHPEGDW